MPQISWDIAIALAFVVGLLLFGISSSMLRSARRQEPRKATAPRWPTLIDDALSGADKQLRLDMIERLSIVRSDWSRDVLAQAREQERDPDIVSAIETALQPYASLTHE